MYCTITCFAPPARSAKRTSQGIVYGTVTIAQMLHHCFSQWYSVRCRASYTLTELKTLRRLTKAATSSLCIVSELFDAEYIYNGITDRQVFLSWINDLYLFLKINYDQRLRKLGQSWAHQGSVSREVEQEIAAERNAASHLSFLKADSKLKSLGTY